MKIEVLIEDQKPLIVFADSRNADKSLNVYSSRDGHATAQRGYLRTLAKPETAAQQREAWQLLKHYASI